MARAPAPFGEILLVILFGTPERGCRDDLRDDRIGEPPRGVPRLTRLFGKFLLLWRVSEDHRAVLIPDVRPLPVERRRVMHLPECLQQLLVADHSGVVTDLHHLGVPGPLAADLLIGGMVSVAPHVAARGV